MSKTFDPINKPAHYNQGSIEPIDYIEANNLGYHEGNVIKYVTRANFKGTKVQDLKKARWYLERLIQDLEKQHVKEITYSNVDNSDQLKNKKIQKTKSESRFDDLKVDDNPPTKIIRRPDDGSKSKEWYQDGKLHRLNGPAIIDYYEDGSIQSESWYQDGKRHRLDGPAYIIYYQDGSIQSESWYQDGKFHRLDGPAEIFYFEEGGSIEAKSWYQDGKRHRLDGPAVIEYHENESVKSEYWYLNDKLHRLDGPAVIKYYPGGSILFEHWYLNGQEITKEQFKQQTKHLQESKGPYFLFKRYCLKG